MQCPKEALKKLMRSPKPLKKDDLLSAQEFEQLAATSFEEFLALNFNAEQLEALFSAEKDQLQAHYESLEKRFERNQRRIRSRVGGVTRGRGGGPRVVVRRVPVSNASVAEATSLRNPPVEVVGEDGLLPVIDNIESIIATEPDYEPREEQSSAIEQEIQDVNDSLAQIDLSQAMAPKELLIEETPAQQPLVDSILEELDLGPPGDASAFLGANVPMPLADTRVRDQILSEFPSLRRPDLGGRFEEFDEAPAEANGAGMLMPPPMGVGISASTPISSVPTGVIRRKKAGDRTTLDDVNLSAIKGPTPALAPLLTENEDDLSLVKGVSLTEAPLMTHDGRPEQVQNNVTIAPFEAETEISAVLPADVSMEDQSQSVQPQENLESQAQAMTETTVQAPEPMQLDPEPAIRPEEPTVQINQPVPVQSNASTSSDSLIDRPRRRVPKVARKVPVYDDDVICLTVHLRNHFEMETCEDWSLFDSCRTMIRSLFANFNLGNRHVPQTRSSNQMRAAPESLAAENEHQPVLRELTTTHADISSIREQSTVQSKLYPIQERPQVEDREDVEAQRKSAPAALLEEIPTMVEVPPIPLLLPDSLVLPEVSLVEPNRCIPEGSLAETNRGLDTGLGIESFLPDGSHLEVPNIMITNATGENVQQEVESARKDHPEQQVVESLIQVTVAKTSIPVQPAPGISEAMLQTPADGHPSAKPTSNKEVKICLLRIKIDI